MRRVLATVMTIGILGVTASCGDDTTEAGGEANGDPSSTTSAASPTEPTSSAPASPNEGAGTRIEITISGHDVSPSGKRVDAEAGEPIELVITSDAAGELHVHTSPEEQQIAYPMGTSTHELVIERPGVVEVESHDAHSVIVQLEVR